MRLGVISCLAFLVVCVLALNYLWAAVLSVMVVRRWRTGSDWRTVPLFGIFGCRSEAFSLPIADVLLHDSEEDSLRNQVRCR